jgi:hypothetical protein
VKDVVVVKLKVLVLLNGFDKGPRYAVNKQSISLANAPTDLIWNTIVVLVLVGDRVVVYGDIDWIPLDDVHIIDIETLGILTGKSSVSAARRAFSGKLEISEFRKLRLLGIELCSTARAGKSSMNGEVYAEEDVAYSVVLKADVVEGSLEPEAFENAVVSVQGSRLFTINDELRDRESS